MGDFYQEKDLLAMNHSRVRRSEILLEFAVTVDAEREMYYREALVLDLYKREKSKSRPRWATDLAPYKKKTAEMLRERGLEKSYCHLEPFFYLYKERVSDEPVWVLFDYEHRDARMNEANMTVIAALPEEAERENG